MQAKQKVTLYLSGELHRQFKIRSAVDGETMSSMAQRAIEFYLTHADVIENSSEVYGHTHRMHCCPQCDAVVALENDALALVSDHVAQLSGDIGRLRQLPEISSDSKSPDGGELITC